MSEQYYHSMSTVPLKDLVKEEYRIYQIYTLMDRAIPYLQDGLKPCQRRILYTLWKNINKGLIKVSSATGLVLTLHPHGPASIESSIVNMAQDFTFTNNYPLIDKKGYFGERMETSPAASRYIECKLGQLTEFLLFDDMDQVEMVPNYDEKVMEPLGLFPKLPLMLLNGSEGIGTGFSSVIPSFHHKDIIDSMLNYINKGKAKKLKPFIRYYSEDLDFDEKGRIITRLIVEKKGDKFFIVELPRGHDSQRIYRYLNKLIEEDYLKDYIDSSVDNNIQIELIFKRGEQEEDLENVQKKLNVTTSIVPNYTLISERGVKVFDKAEQIIEIFTEQRIKVVRNRYIIWADKAEKRLAQNNEIIRFIDEKQYAKAQAQENRKAYVDYLKSKKFEYAEYLADMAIYRMTKEEVKKRELMIKEDQAKLKDYRRIAKSDALVKEKLCEELMDIREKMTQYEKEKDKKRQELYKKVTAKKETAKK